MIHSLVGERMKYYKIKYDGEWVNIQRMLGSYVLKKVDSEEKADLIPEYKIEVGLKLARDYCDLDRDRAELIEYVFPDE